MSRRRKVEIRSAQELRSDTGRLHQAKGAAMRDLRLLQSLNGQKPGRKAKAKPAPARPGGIQMGS